jgi:hypothetical protein
LALDEEDLELLKKCLPGNRTFKPSSSSPEDVDVFDRIGDRLLALQDRGLLEIPDKLIRSYHGRGRYSLIVVRRVTALGQEELRRHSPPPEPILSAIRAKVRQDLVDRQNVLGQKYNEETGRFGTHGALHSRAARSADGANWD